MKWFFGDFIHQKGGGENKSKKIARFFLYLIFGMDPKIDMAN